MATARIFPPKIFGTDWNDAVGATDLPLTGTGSNRLHFNSTNTTWEFYLNNVLVAVLDADGNLKIKGQIMEGQTL